MHPYDKLRRAEDITEYAKEIYLTGFHHTHKPRTPKDAFMYAEKFYDYADEYLQPFLDKVIEAETPPLSPPQPHPDC